MSGPRAAFVPSEFVNGRYRPIGGSYDSLDRAVEAVKGHFRNVHGGRAATRTFHADGAAGVHVLVEVGFEANRPPATLAIYEIIEGEGRERPSPPSAG
jgi:hypothetical protein